MTLDGSDVQALLSRITRSKKENINPEYLNMLKSGIEDSILTSVPEKVMKDYLKAKHLYALSKRFEENLVPDRGTFVPERLPYALDFKGVRLNANTSPLYEMARFSNRFPRKDIETLAGARGTIGALSTAATGGSPQTALSVLLNAPAAYGYYMFGEPAARTVHGLLTPIKNEPAILDAMTRVARQNIYAGED